MSSPVKVVLVEWAEKLMTNKIGRPRKQGAHIQLKSAHWRIVIPHLQQYRAASSGELMQLKYSILQKLKNPRSQKKKSEFQRGLRYYRIALEHHADGTPHLDVLLSYDKSIRCSLSNYDYFYKHGNVTTYRRLNQAIIAYGTKQDKDNLHNFPVDISSILELQQLKADPYKYLYDQMCKDPLHFHLEQYVKKHQLSYHISGWSSIKTKLRDMQQAAANLTLKQKPGFRFIDRTLIQSCLSPRQLLSYDSWSGYQKIVDYFNQVSRYGVKRPFKTKNLLVVGPAHIGKTSLISQPNNEAGRTPLQSFVTTYHMGMKHWFPKYQDGVYKLILWDQFKLTSYSYDFLLKFLQGSPVDLPYHGGATKKADNQLVYMTSNLPLERHIQLKFWDQSDRESARQNLAKRIEEVVVPEGYDLFLLQKLIVRTASTISLTKPNGL